jgi:hypothetical protein
MHGRRTNKTGETWQQLGEGRLERYTVTVNMKNAKFQLSYKASPSLCLPALICPSPEIPVS